MSPGLKMPAYGGGFHSQVSGWWVFAPALAASTVIAINTALTKAKNLFEDTVTNVVTRTSDQLALNLHRLRIPQVVDGSNWQTTIVLVNTDSIPVQFTVMFHQADGTP